MPKSVLPLSVNPTVAQIEERLAKVPQIDGYYLLDENTKKHILKAKSANTLRAYFSDWSIFKAWCEHRGVDCMPAHPFNVANFISAQAKQKEPDLKTTTINRRLAAIRYFHKLYKINPLPTNDEYVTETMAGIRLEKLSRVDQKAPSTDDIMVQMVEEIDTGTLLGLRDRALLLLGFSGAFRRSELVAVKLEDIKFRDEGMDVYIPKSKTDQEGKGETKPILKGLHHCPVRAVKDWINAANLEEGYLFRRINPKKHDQIMPSHGDPNKPEITDQVVAFVVKKYTALLGLDPADYAGHSLRSGFVTSALEHGATFEKVTNVTKQKDLKTVMRYYRTVKHFDDHAADGLL